MREDLFGPPLPAYDMRRTVPHDGAPYLSSTRASEEAIREWIRMSDERDEYSPDRDHDVKADPVVHAASCDVTRGLPCSCRTIPLSQAQQVEEPLEQTASFKPHFMAAVVHLPGHPVGSLWIFDETWQGDKFMQNASMLQRAMVRAMLQQMINALDRREEMDG